MTSGLVDVVAVDLDSRRVLWVMSGKTEANAEAIIGMAVYRQGVEDRFFTTTKVGKYEEGDTYRGDEL